MTLEKNLFTMNISPHSGNIFDLGADSYKVGADRLVNVLMKNPATNEMLVSTIVHLYRQFLEYKLKETIRFINIAIDDKDETPTHHRLEILLKSFVEIYENMHKKINLDIENIGLEFVYKVITEFSVIDKLLLYAECGENTDNIEVDVILMKNNIHKVASFFNDILEKIQISE